MKKKILLSIVPIIAISSPILIASSCDNVIKDDFFEKRAKETDEEIEKSYIMILNNLNLIKKDILNFTIQTIQCIWSEVSLMKKNISYLMILKNDMMILLDIMKFLKK